MEQAHQQRNRLQKDQDAKGRDQGFEQEDRLDPADRNRAFEDLPGIAHRWPLPIKERQHRRDQQKDMTEDVDLPSRGIADLGIEDIHADMLVH